MEALFGQKDSLISTGDVSSTLATSLGRFLPYGAGFGVSRSIGSDSVSKKTKAPMVSLPKVEMSGPPIRLEKEYKKIKCVLNIKEPINCYVQVIAVIDTIDGAVTSALADNRITIKSITFGESEGHQTEAVRFGEDIIISLNKKGCYVFSLEVFGDIDFDLKLKRIQRGSV